MIDLTGVLGSGLLSGFALVLLAYFFVFPVRFFRNLLGLILR